MLWLRWTRDARLEHGTLGHPLLEPPLASLDPAEGPPNTELLELLELGVPHMRLYIGN